MLLNFPDTILTENQKQKLDELTPDVRERTADFAQIEDLRQLWIAVTGMDMDPTDCFDCMNRMVDQLEGLK